MKKNDKSLFLTDAKRWLELRPVIAVRLLVLLFWDSLPVVFRFYCLHPNGRLRKNDILEEVLDDEIRFRLRSYCIAHPSDDESIRAEKRDFECLGLGDFYFYNLMLLWILPPLSPVSTKVAIAVGHVLAVQIGLDVSDRLAHFYKQVSCPALPMPVVAVSIYAFLLDWAIK
jgi:hypothetical protein